MMVYELCRKDLREEFKNDAKKMIRGKMYILWDEERVKHAFNFGNGTMKDFKRYMKDNKIYCRYYDAESKSFIY